MKRLIAVFGLNLLACGAFAANVCPSEASVASQPPRQIELSRTQEMVSAMKGVRLPTLIVGDSIAGLWQANLPSEAFNYGIGGDRTQWILWRLDQVDFSSAHFENVIVIAGTNNTSERYAPCETATGVIAIARKLKARMPSTRILVMSLLPRGRGLAERDDHIRDTNTQLKESASSIGYVFIDAYTAFRTTCGHDDTCGLYTPDAIHPSIAGYEVFKQLVSPHLANTAAPN